MKKLLILFLVLFALGCASNQAKKPADKPAEKQAKQSETIKRIDTSPEIWNLVKSGYQKLFQKQPKEAMIDFDQAIKLCDEQFNDKTIKYYAARTPAETIIYFGTAKQAGQSALIFDNVCSDAQYYRGFALVKINEVELAQDYLLRAIDLSPYNSLYLSELGHIYQVKSDWKKALEVFMKSEEAANYFSPEKFKNTELSRAKRGVGFSLIELGELDKAEAKFKECLEINPNDKTAQNELNYIKKLRSQSNKQGV